MVDQYGNGISADNTPKNFGRLLTDNSSKSFSSIGSINNQNKDIVEYIANEKDISKKQKNRRKIMWQMIIFLMAFVINFVISFRDHFVVDITQSTPDSGLNFAMNLCKGIGCIVIGNLYDNISTPKKLTFALLLCLSLFTLLNAAVDQSDIFPDTTVEPFSDDIQDDQLVTFQMASLRVFESGVMMACLIILYNWFTPTFRYFMVALWEASYLLMPIIQVNCFNNIPDYFKLFCYVMSGVYFVISVLCYFFFHHHPLHIGIQVHQSSKGHSGFFLDFVAQGSYGLSATQRFKKVKMNVTLVDAFGYFPVPVFIISFVLKNLHTFSLYLQTATLTDYFYYQKRFTTYYYFGEIIGILTIGFLADNVLKKKLYITVSTLNLLLIVYLLVSFSHDDQISFNESLEILVSIIVGALQGSSDFLYQCLLPLKIAKDITERKINSMSSSYDQGNVSFVGTIIGVTLGTTYIMNTVLFVNVAFIIDRIGENGYGICTFLCLLLLLSIAVLYRGIRTELLQYKCIRKCFPKKIKSRNVRDNE